ncbi:MAG: nucleotidyltransferase family protein [Clostridia bacterium]|nr:nucleotidyltransferase family protein [Clostridia bacterium]
MKALGIVAEYNPFHNGHKYQLEKAMEISGADVSVAVMSGNFTQRGEAAIFSKWDRAGKAVEGGVNLVIELPSLFAVSSAGTFARGGTKILEGLKCSYISFGVEEEDHEKLLRLAEFIKRHRKSVEELIKRDTASGKSYPKRREEALNLLTGENLSEILSLPNNILALEYLSNMEYAEPLPVIRHMIEHNGKAIGNFASGSFIRSSMLDGEDISSLVPVSYDGLSFCDGSKLLGELQTVAMNSSTDFLNSIFGAEEGLGDIIKNRYRYWNTLNDAINDMKSKRYTETRITRVILSTVLGIRKSDVNSAKLYARVLAFDSKGQEYLSYLKKQEDVIPVITNISRQNTDDVTDTLMFDIKASDLYNKISGKNLYENSDFVVMPSRF